MPRLPRSAFFQKIWTREFDEFLRTAAVAHQNPELAAGALAAGALVDRAGHR